MDQHIHIYGGEQRASRMGCIEFFLSVIGLVVFGIMLFAYWN